MHASDSSRTNVADRLAESARADPNAIALVAAARNGADVTLTRGALNADADTLARGLRSIGVGRGKRIALLVKPGVEFVTLVFALLRTGATMVLVDSGMGRKHLVDCLAATEPHGFVSIPLGHAMRVLKRGRFPRAKLNVTVGRRWFWGGQTLRTLRRLGEQHQAPPPHVDPTDDAAIVFTSGSTGPPKGVRYTHHMFETQCAMIQQEYDLRAGAVDLACFPLFGLFNVACGVTTVLPQMDFARPASCDPAKLVATANRWECTQAFASPAVWDRVSRHCEATSQSIPTLRKVLSCGAPVAAPILRRTLKCAHPDAQMHTPYGATEALPIATIEAREILDETAAKTDQGAGVCVGRRFGSGQKAEGETTARDGANPTDFDWRIVRITDDPIPAIDQAEELPEGEVGELIVRGPQVSCAYLSESAPQVVGATANAQAKIADGATDWHRTGDVGYFDEQRRFWYCGRKSQRVVTRDGVVYTECAEGVLNAHPEIARSAIVGIGPPGDQAAVACVLLPPGRESEWFEPGDGPRKAAELGRGALATTQIATAAPVAELPVDVRHNSKILREVLRDTVLTELMDWPQVHGERLAQLAAEQAKHTPHHAPPHASWKPDTA